MEHFPMTLQELVHAETLQQLRDTFFSIAGTMTYMVDEGGACLTEQNGACRLCDLAKKAGLCTDTCQSSVTQKLCDQGRKNKRPAVGICPVTELTIAAVPLFVGEYYLGSWIVGQLYSQPVSPRQVAAIARRLQTRERSVARCMERILPIPKKQWNAAFAFLRDMSAMLLDINLSRKTFTRFVDASSVSMYITDYHTGEYLMVNRHYAEHMGVPIKELVGKFCWQVDGGFASAFCSCCPRAELLDENGRLKGPYRWRHYSQTRERYYQNTSQAIKWVDGRLAHMVTSMDVTKEQKMERDLYRLAYYDRLLSLPNDIRMQLDLEAYLAEDDLVHLIFFNVASMQQLNDVYGRECGDEMLRVVSQWAQERADDHCWLYRIHGDEFCFLLRHTGSDAAAALAQSVFDRFAQVWFLNVDGKPFSYYCGVSVSLLYADRHFSLQDMPSLVQRTLNLSRRENQVVIYDAVKDSTTKSYIRMVLELKNCVQQDMLGFEVHYQPIAEVISGSWKAVEALCRWTGPVCGSVPPDIFIREAEQNGLIKRVGEWVLETAVRQCKEIGLDQCEGFFLSVNISPIQIMDERFVDLVTDITNRYDYPRDKLTLEVTESIEFTFNDFTVKIIERLRRQGVKLALDDFGTGYSSYNNMRNLQLNFLKTERDFIRGIEQDRSLQYFYYAMAELAHANGMKMIAEGIETEEQLEVTFNNGADLFQGYLFSKPIPANKLAEALPNFVCRQQQSFWQQRTKYGNLEQWLVGLEAYTIAPDMFHLLHLCIHILLSGEDLNLAFYHTLQTVGEHFQLSRASFYIRKPPQGCAQSHEWCNEGTPQKVEIMNAQFPRVVEAFLSTMQTEELFITTDAFMLPPEQQAVIAEFGERAVALNPIWSGSQLLGYISFSDSKLRNWRTEEIVILWNLGKVLAEALEKGRLKQELHELHELHEKIGSSPISCTNWSPIYIIEKRKGNTVARTIDCKADFPQQSATGKR